MKNAKKGFTFIVSGVIIATSNVSLPAVSPSDEV